MNKETDYLVRNWKPVKLYPEADDILCRWLFTGNKRFTEPFFDDTIGECRKFPENGHMKRSMSSVQVLPEWAGMADAASPAAFIFHISRCGSTLISQMLSTQPGNIVLSEVPFFDELLRHGKRAGCMEEVLPLLQAAVRLYSNRQEPVQQRTFIKTDSWHIHFYKELRTLYPTVPFFLLYRKPDEVIRSQQKKRGMQAVPNLIEAGIFGFDKETIGTVPLDEYMAMVIETYLDAFVQVLQQDKNAYAINYHDGAMEIINTIASVTGLPVSGEEKQQMEERSGYHAKFPGEKFREENPADPVPDYLKRCFRLYDHVEALRLQKDQ